MITFSNPRLHAEITNYPLGSNKRGLCVFHVEHTNKGYRFTRVTTGKPKTATYGGKAAIVDGSDGRTYLIQFAGSFDFIHILASDFKCPNPDVYPSGVFPQDPQYDELKKLIKQANCVDAADGGCGWPNMCENCKK